MIKNALNESRFYKVKSPSTKFLCALCNSPRQLKYSKNLSTQNYLQIIVLSVFLSWALWPWMHFKALTLIFIIWSLFETINKTLYRKEIPCPHCGFDATWYRRNVKVAKEKVVNFWSSQSAIEKNNPNEGEENTDA